MARDSEGFGELAQPDQTLDGRYELIEQVGAGGMGQVWSARDARLRRRVAIKIFTGAIDESRRRKIEREARALAAVSHPHIVSVFDYGEAHTAGGDIRPYVVMELVDGPDLQRYLMDHGPMPVAQARDVLGSVLAAVERAHQVGIVHGDLKPANVFMGSDGPKVGDFGVARILDEETGSTTVAATPTFAAPEVLKGARPTTASDVYSAGCLAFQLLVGRPPYEGTNAWEVASKHIEAPVPKVGTLRSAIPSGLDAAIQRAMSKDPQGRYPDAVSFAGAIAAAPHEIDAATVSLAAGPPTRGVATEALTGRRPDLARAALLGPLARPWERGLNFVLRQERARWVLAFALIAFLLLIAFLVMRDGAPSVAAVPDVIGDPYSEAAAEMRLAGFTVDASFRPAEEREFGRVIETIPRASVEVASGTKVHLIVGATTAEEQRKKLEEQQKKAEEERRRAEEQRNKEDDD